MVWCDLDTGGPLGSAVNVVFNIFCRIKISLAIKRSPTPKNSLLMDVQMSLLHIHLIQSQIFVKKRSQEVWSEGTMWAERWIQWLLPFHQGTTHLQIYMCTIQWIQRIEIITLKHITIQHILAPQQGIMHLSPSHSNTKDMLGEY